MEAGRHSPSSPEVDPLIRASLTSWHASSQKTAPPTTNKKAESGAASRRARNERKFGSRSKGAAPDAIQAITSEAKTVNVSKAVTDQIGRLQDEGDLYTRKIEKERRKLEDLKLTHQNLVETLRRERALQQKKFAEGIRGEQALQQQLSVLDDRLEKAILRKNDIVAKNETVKREVDCVRRERMVLDEGIVKLEKKLATKKKELGDIVNATNELFQEKQRVIRSLEEQQRDADREQEEFEEDWRRLGKALESDLGMNKTLMEGVSQDHDFVKEDQKSTQDILEAEKKFKNAIARGQWQVAREKAQAQISQDKVQNFEDAFKKLESMMGIENIDELVEKFIDEETYNFRLYNSINDMNAEIEQLDSSIVHIEDSISKYKDQGADAESQRVKILKDLEDKLQRSKTLENTWESRLENSRKRLEQLRQGIGSVFSTLGCSNSASLDLVGADGVTEENVLQYLGIIEQRTNEVLQVYASTNEDAIIQAAENMPSSREQLAAVGGDAAHAFLCTGPQVPQQTIVLRVDPPNLDDLSSDEDEIEMASRPLTRKELEVYTARSMKKENSRNEHRPRARVTIRAAR